MKEREIQDVEFFNINFEDLFSQAKEALREHITVSDWYLERHIQEFVENMKLISETKIENDEDLQVLKGKLHEPADFTVLVNASSESLYLLLRFLRFIKGLFSITLQCLLGYKVQFSFLKHLH